MQMNLTVERQYFTNKSTIGTLLVDGTFFCFTLEPPKRDDDVKPRCIGVGTFEVKIRYSPKHKRPIPHVDNVPGFTEIEIHILNRPEETEGCLGVGDEFHPDLPDFIGKSGVAFERLFGLIEEAIKAGDKVFITYCEPIAEAA